MYGAAVSTAREATAEISTELQQFDRTAVWLFGSWARGAANHNSDIDTLVVVAHRGHVEAARSICESAGVSAIVTDTAQLNLLPVKSPLFALHLATESELVHGHAEPVPVVWGRPQQAKATHRALSRLEAARHEASVWGADSPSAQSMVFAAAKEWAMLQAALAGDPEFDRWRALGRLLRNAADEASLRELEAVWLAKRSRRAPPVLVDPERVIEDVLDLARVPAGA
jgi:hypothetical protein